VNKTISQTSLNNVMNQYGLTPEMYEAVSYGNGHINDTFLVSPRIQYWADACYILQRINTTVFRNPDALMENITGVTDFLRKDIEKHNGDTYRETLTVLNTKENGTMAKDSEGGCWRLYLFVKKTVSCETVENPIVFRNAGVAFGRFMKRLANYPAHTLHETIPHFHNTRQRFENLRQAVIADTVGRAKNVQSEIDFFYKRESEYGILLDLLEKVKLPLRVTHNDTKLNNILFDADSGEGICVVDLDTVMPGLCLYDFGDAIRFGANTAAEDEMDLSKVTLSLELFEAYTKGYLSETADVLTPLERELLPTGSKMMTVECGMRFLTDYLYGDVYFKIKHQHHNLDRARTQVALTADMEKKWKDMVRICLHKI